MIQPDFIESKCESRRIKYSCVRVSFSDDPFIFDPASCLIGRLWNRDGGDCTGIFLSSGQSALQACNRAVCQIYFEDYLSVPGETCQSQCFNASCDWSDAMCSLERASLATCPLFDATVLQSIAVASTNRTLHFVEGGTARLCCVASY